MNRHSIECPEWERRRWRMNQEEVERGFAGAGWELDGSFYKHLIIGFVDDLSIIAYRQTWKTEDPKFQLCDHENDLSCWVGEIPTPQRAAELLREHGEPLDG
jgi:hypothetical protein